MPRRRRHRYETSITATLNRQWDQMADFIIVGNVDKTDDEIVALIRAQHGCKSVEWVRSRRRVLAPKPSGTRKA